MDLAKGIQKQQADGGLIYYVYEKVYAYSYMYT
jgi:hypothetical protein